MAAAPTKASAKTTLKWGTIEVPVGLFKTTADPAKELKFEQGGPNGGRLVTRATTAEAEPEAQASDPLALEPNVDVSASGKSVFVSDGDVGGGPPTAVPVLVEEGTEQIVERADIRRGVWLRSQDGTDDERFVDCTAQLEHIEAITALEVMEIQGAIDIGRVPRERVIGSYYVGTDGEGAPKVLALLNRAMAKNRRGLVVKWTWTKTRRQATGVLVPSGRNGVPTIVLLQLCWPEDWREIPKRADLTATGNLFSDVEMEKASELVRAMADSSRLLEEQRDEALVMRERVRDLALEGKLGVFRMPKQAPERTVLEDLEASLDAQLAGV